MFSLFFRKFIIRLRHWEYWNSTIIYLPLYPIWLWYTFKTRNIYFLTAANPTIKNGGYIMESKHDVYQLIPKQYYPKTFYYKPNTQQTKITQDITAYSLQYPLILKPDFGEKGIAVKKVSNEKELSEYINNIDIPFLVQQHVHYPHEVGIFYYKIPGEEKGNISGIVAKEQVIITGDGINDVENLVIQEDRFLLQLEQIRQTYPTKMQYILNKGEQMILVPYGNHARGSKFTDISDKISSKLVNTVNTICSEIDGFYYGRLDIMYNSWQELENGINFSIIELNGSGSEPTHIYDPKYSIFDAWRIIKQHWNILYQICKKNHDNGIPYNRFREVRQDELTIKKIIKSLSAKHW